MRNIFKRYISKMNRFKTCDKETCTLLLHKHLTAALIRAWLGFAIAGVFFPVENSHAHPERGFTQKHMFQNIFFIEMRRFVAAGSV